MAHLFSVSFGAHLSLGKRLLKCIYIYAKLVCEIMRLVNPCAACLYVYIWVWACRGRWVYIYRYVVHVSGTTKFFFRFDFADSIVV